jgi:glycosyltransferase involved in cell wall biosynthesis
MPSLKEGWGITVMEAATHGTPAVGFRGAGGIAESIVDRRTGMLCDSFDEFVTALDRLLSDEALRQDLGERARMRAREFSWDETARRFGAVLAEVAETGTTSAPAWVPAPRRVAVSMEEPGGPAGHRSP